jgi:hypothetical protein
MANDVIYPGGVRLSDAEHTALASLGLHAENGIAKTDVEPLVTETRDAQAAVVEAARADNAPTQAELDARTEAPDSWDGRVERRNGTDRRVVDHRPWRGRHSSGASPRPTGAQSPPAKTEVDETVTEQPETARRGFGRRARSRARSSETPLGDLAGGRVAGSTCPSRVRATPSPRRSSPSRPARRSRSRTRS